MSDIPLCLWSSHAWPDGALFDRAWDQFTGVMGRPAKMMMCYTPVNAASAGGAPMAQWPSYMDSLMGLFAATPRTAGCIPVLGFGLGGVIDGAQLAQLASGAWDSVIRGVLAACLTHGYRTVYLRPGWEMNGGWYPWTITAANAGLWVKAYQVVVTVARAFAQSNGMTLRIVWNPNAGGTVPMTTTGWPGKGYVDVIALDQYSEPIDVNWLLTAPLSAPSGTSKLVWADLVALAKANGLPLAYAECGGSSASFATQVVQSCAQARSQLVPIEYVGMYVDPNWCDGTLPATAAAWVAGFGATGSLMTGIWPPKRAPTADNTMVGANVAIFDNDGSTWAIVGDKVVYNNLTIPYTAAVRFLAKANGGGMWQNGSDLWWPFGPPDTNGIPTSPGPAVTQSPIVVPVTHLSVAAKVNRAGAMLSQSNALLTEILADLVRLSP